MTATAVIRAYYAGLHQADAAAALGDVEAVRRAVRTALDTARRQALPAAECFAWARSEGDVSLKSRAAHRAEDCNAFLVLHQLRPGKDGEDGPFAVTHQPSGARLGLFADRPAGRAAAAELHALPIDWACSTILELRTAVDRSGLTKAASAILTTHGHLGRKESA
jgi:hypothetical protein